ncbi:hypothetical protein ACQKK5_08050 [Brevibacillus panacihumi]|uniref:hypothetical protein n=1 Tax=Brevibacillus panacihumi TaxID=497735 RepID=UPI003D028EEB
MWSGVIEFRVHGADTGRLRFVFEQEARIVGMVREESVRFRCDRELNSVIFEYYALLRGVLERELASVRCRDRKLRAITESFPHMNEIELQVFDNRAPLAALAATKRDIIGLLRLHALIAEKHFEIALVRT